MAGTEHKLKKKKSMTRTNPHLLAIYSSRSIKQTLHYILAHRSMCTAIHVQQCYDRSYVQQHNVEIGWKLRLSGKWLTYIFDFRKYGIVHILCAAHIAHRTYAGYILSLWLWLSSIHLFPTLCTIIPPRLFLPCCCAQLRYCCCCFSSLP